MTSNLPSQYETERNLVAPIGLRRVLAGAGVRGPDYAWANSRRFQAALADARIAYEHHPDSLWARSPSGTYWWN